MNSQIPVWKKLVKRGIDILFSFLALILLSPFIILIALAIRLNSRGSVFFKQERAGYSGKPFFMWKFRTMIQGADKDKDYDTYKGDPRITKVGKFLRNWTLDEIPQFWNVLKGEMSLVGPRPALVHQVESYTPTQKIRLLVKPGMTGLAQIIGRNNLTWPQRIELDLKYIKTFSLTQDSVILLKTIGLVLSRKGIYGEKIK
ncbi:MAG: sugar transferase [Firmicutes bacterium]|jgi:lipopolysaccharide/colanic/teichoic acid biosynthesis glycosyltransferase|nr:sugar transferase [Bacillota bacterium]